VVQGTDWDINNKFISVCRTGGGMFMFFVMISWILVTINVSNFFVKLKVGCLCFVLLRFLEFTSFSI